jgi:hypothetical protein
MACCRCSRPFWRGGHVSAVSTGGCWDGRLARVPCSLRYGDVMRLLRCSLAGWVLRMPALDQPTSCGTANAAISFFLICEI